METIDKKFTELISKLQSLKELAKQYQEKWPYGEVDHRGLNTGADNYWSQNVQPLIEAIELDLEDIWDYLTAYTKQGDNFGGYFPPVGTVEQNLRKDINYVINKSKKSDEIEALIQHLKIVQRRHIHKQTSGKAGDEIKTTPETDGRVIDDKGWRRIWLWVKRHPHIYSLAGSLIFLILFFVVGLFKSQWRNWCWGTAAFAFLVLILSLLGGRTR